MMLSMQNFCESEYTDPLRTLNNLISPVSIKSRDVYNRLAQRKNVFAFSKNQQENINTLNVERQQRYCFNEKTHKHKEIFVYVVLLVNNLSLVPTQYQIARKQ